MNRAPTNRRRLRLTIVVAAAAAAVAGPVVVAATAPPTDPPDTVVTTDVATTVESPAGTSPPTSEDPVDSTAPEESMVPEDSTTPPSDTPIDSTPPTSEATVDATPATTEAPIDSLPSECPTISSTPVDEETVGPSPAAPSAGEPIGTATDAPDPADPCAPVIECPTPTYAEGIGSYDGSGGGVTAVEKGRTPAPPALTRDATVARAIGETLTGMDYTADAGNASGAYLITNDDWAGFNGYDTAAGAPPAVQDEHAAQVVRRVRTEIDGDNAAVAGAWLAKVTTTDLFMNEFVAYFESNLADIEAAGSDAVETAPPSLRGGDIAFPVLGPVQYGDTFGAPRGGLPGDEEMRCHEGTDIFGANGQPILAPVSGVVEIGVGDPALSGIALSVSGGGYRYNLVHLSGIAPGMDNGTYVNAGQIVGYMGATGNGGVPHLHFEIRDGSGNAVPSFGALNAAASRQHGAIGIGPWSAIVTSAATSHRVVSTTTGHGEWVIDDAGRVTATGDAALIAPTGEAGAALAYGTDAAG